MRTLKKTPSKAATASKAATTIKPHQLTENPDGTIKLHGDLAKRTEAAAAARGISVEEYVNLALRKGADIVVEQALFEEALFDGMLPVYLEADTVQFLREACKAGGITAEDFAEAIIGDAVRDTFNGSQTVEELIVDSWELPDKESARVAVDAVVARWKAKQLANA